MRCEMHSFAASLSEYECTFGAKNTAADKLPLKRGGGAPLFRRAVRVYILYRNLSVVHRTTLSFRPSTA